MKFLIFFALCVGVAVAQLRPSYYNQFDNNYNRNYNRNYDGRYEPGYGRNYELDANGRSQFQSEFYNNFNRNLNRDYNGKIVEPSVVKSVAPEVDPKTQVQSDVNNKLTKNLKISEPTDVKKVAPEVDAKTPVQSDFYKKYDNNYNRNYNYNSKYSDPSYVYSGGPEGNAKTVKETYEISPDGSYNHGFETDSGIVVQAEGSLKSYGPNSEAAELVQGTFAWTSPEGQHISYSYTADENGYHPVKNN